MIGRKIFQIVIFGFLTLISIINVKATEPLLLADLGRQKEISNVLHKEPHLSEQLKEEHNLLGGEVNGFIEAIVTVTIAGSDTQKDKEELEERKIKINKMANSLYQHLHEQNNKEKNRMGLESQMANLKSQSLFGGMTSVSLINVEIGPESVKEFLKLFKTNESKAKDYYIGKLEEKSWKVIP